MYVMYLCGMGKNFVTKNLPVQYPYKDIETLNLFIIRARQFSIAKGFRGIGPALWHYFKVAMKEWEQELNLSSIERTTQQDDEAPT